LKGGKIDKIFTVTKLRIKVCKVYNNLNQAKCPTFFIRKND